MLTVDSVYQNFGPISPATLTAAPRKKPPELALFKGIDFSANGPNPGGGWTDLSGGGGGDTMYRQDAVTNAPLSASAATANGTWSALMAFFGKKIATPTFTQILAVTGNTGAAGNNQAFAYPLMPTPGDNLLLLIQLDSGPSFNLIYFSAVALTVTDDAGNNFQLIGNQQNLDGVGRGSGLLLFYAENLVALGGNNLHIHTSADGGTGGVGMGFNLYDVAGLGPVQSVGNFLAMGMG